MNLRNLAVALGVAAMLPALAYADNGADAIRTSFDRAFLNDAFVGSYSTKSDQVSASFDRAFINDAFINASRDKADQVVASFDRAFINDSFLSASREANPVVASFDRAFGGEALVHAYRTNADQAVASFERGLSHDPITSGNMLAKADPLDFINRSLGLGKDAVVASFERDLLGNATSSVKQPDTVLASFERDFSRDPVPVAVATAQDAEEIFRIEPDTILAGFYYYLHWMPGSSAVFVR